MKLSEVSVEDAKRCAALASFLKHGEWKLSGDDIDELVKVKAWVHSLTLSMAETFKSKPAKPEIVKEEKKSDAPKSSSEGIKVKRMGKLKDLK